MKVIGQTRLCINCGKPAKYWTGWMLHHLGPVLAGFCTKRCLKRRQHCYGDYYNWMGKEKA